MTAIVRNFLDLHGEALIDQGYTVVPIQQGKKAPGYDGWQKSKPSKDQVKEWLTGGFKNAGVGILTRFTCAIDIDCRNETTAAKFAQWCVDRIGVAPMRIGLAPKILLLYRTTEPFRKRKSTEYIDEWGEKQMIEVLGDGQQFVAFHIHPETGKPYYWIDGKSPLNVRATDLTELKPAVIDDLFKDFDAWCRECEFKVLKERRDGPNGGPSAAEVWSEDTTAIDISRDELRTRLLLIPGADVYELWVQIGMCLSHQFDGGQEGFDLWSEWSETADNFDPDALERHWKSFAIDGKKRAPLTARYILRLAKESIAKSAMELGIKLRDAFINAKDLAEWEAVRLQCREADIDALSRSTLAHVAKDRRDAITGTRTTLIEIKKAISYLPRQSETTPKWCEGWVYDTGQDKFFHLDKKIATTKMGFDAMFDRYALTKADIVNGRASPSMTASDLALNSFRIPIVQARRYMPGRDNIFHDPDGTFANTYPEHEIPELPEKVVPRDKINVDRVKHHVGHLLADPVEQRMLIDWMSWVVQNPGRHVNYAVLLQGVEGDGKTFFAEMMRVVMGISNVNIASANTVIKSDFSDWAYGACLCAIEEIRLVNNRATDKWEAINKIKPFITNHIIEVHPKGLPVFNAVNTMSYMLFSNFRDALPIDDNSRRYNVLFSRWQTREAIHGFKDEHPHYYERLYATLSESPGALRKWLLEHQQHDKFNPMGDAPETQARSVMIRKAKPEVVQLIDDLIAEDKTLGASSVLLDITELQDVISGMGVEWPGPKTLTTMLERENYEKLGKVRITDLGLRMFYSRNTDLFMSSTGRGQIVDATKVRQYRSARQAALDGTEF